MQTSIWYTIAATPWWVYPLGVYICWMACMTTRPRVVPVKQAYYLPSFILSMAVMLMVMQAQTLTTTHIYLWGTAILIGAVIGYFQLTFSRIRAIEHTQLLYLPGNWAYLAILLTFLSAKYYFQWPLLPDTSYFTEHKTAFVLLAGFTPGLFVGRLAWVLRRARLGPFISQESIALT